MEKGKEIRPLTGNRISRDQLVTLADLHEFKEDLLVSIKAIIQANNPQPLKKWLKSYEVRKLLNISPGTLQTLRSNGTIPFTRIGGMIYYDASDVDRMLTDRKRDFNKEFPSAFKSTGA